MAGTWTISRDRPDAEPGQDLRAMLSRVGSRAAQATLIRPQAGAGPVRHRVQGIRSRPAGRDRSARRAGRPIRAWWAVPLIALMTAAAVALAWVTVSLAEAGVAATHAAASISGGPLVAPAPRSAGELPRRFSTTPNPADQLIISQLEQRFSAISGQLLAAAGRANPARPVTAIRPSGLYGQPGHLDPLTSQPSWVLYLGLQSSATLGHPLDTISSLMMGILGKYSKVGPWPVAAGHRGGQANCTLAWLGKTEVSVCGWATGRTIGVVASPERETSVRELAMVLIQMRYELQRGSR